MLSAVMPHPVDPSELSDTARLAVTLAEGVGAALALKAVAGLEVRLDTRHLLVVRRPDGSIETKQFAAAVRHRDGGAASVPCASAAAGEEAALRALRDAPRVPGCFEVSDLGRPPAPHISPPLDYPEVS